MSVELQEIAHSYATESGLVPVLGKIDLSVAVNEVVAILGPSGCGKSTLFNIIAGLLKPALGNVLIDGWRTNGKCGHVAYMMQRDLLLKWRTVLENATLAAEIGGLDRAVVTRAARELMPRFGLAGFEDNYPSALSGGMRQRAALMRTLLCDRPVILLDEPFSALDSLTRTTMHEWLLQLWQDFPRTVILITHDPEEAVFLADKVYVLSPRPATVRAVIDVPVPRPRRVEDLKSKELQDIKYRILSLVRDVPEVVTA